MGNCYTSIQSMIEFRLPDSSIGRMQMFRRTTFADHGTSLGMILSYMALAVASVSLPEVMIFFVALGGGVRAFYYAT